MKRPPHHVHESHVGSDDAGWAVNRKRVERILRREGLKVPQKQHKRGRLWLNDGSCIRLRVTDRLLPRCLLRLEAVGELGIVDEVIKELVPGVGGETRRAEHVRQFFDAVIG